MIVTISFSTDGKKTETVQTAMSPEELKDEAAALEAAQAYMDSLTWVSGAKVIGLDVQYKSIRPA